LLATFASLAIAVGSGAADDLPNGGMNQALVLQAVKRDRARLERERAERETAEARAERQRSKTAFRGLSASAARQVALAKYPRQVGRRAFQAPGARKDESVKEYFNDDLTARVHRDGATADALAESTFPLRATTASGQPAPLDLSIVERNGGFEPANPLAAVHLPTKLATGLSLSDLGLGLRLVGAAAGSEAATVDSGAFYANAATDTDLLAQVVPNGLQASLTIRSPESPEDYLLELELPTGAHVEEASGRVPGVLVRRGEERLANLGPPVAFDAQGEPVTTSYQLGGDRLRLHVDHRGRDLAYPLLVDPWLVEDQRYWKAIKGYSVKDKQGWNYAESDPKNFISGYVDLAGGAWGNGLYIVGGSNRSGAWGQWNFFSPGDAWIYRAEFYASHYVDPDGTASIYETVQPPSLDRWEHQDNLYDENAQFLGALFDTPWSWPHSFDYFYLTHCFGDSPCGYYNSNPFGPAATPGNFVDFAQVGNNDWGWAQTWLGGAYLEIGDDKAPTATSIQHSGLPGGWVENASPSVSVGLNDSGVGMWKVDFGRIVGGNIVQGIGGDGQWPCTGDRPQHCNHNESAGTSYETSTHPEGDNTYGVQATDYIGNRAQAASWHIKLDRSAPTLDLSGGLFDRAGKTIDGGFWDLAADATDGDASSAVTARSGVVKIEVSVKTPDGQVQTPSGGVVQQDCPAGSCPLSLDWTLDTAAFPEGTLTVTVRATDQLGHAASQSFSVTNAHDQAECEGAAAYTPYNAGSNFDNLSMTSASRSCTKANDAFTQSADTTYIYGDCDATVSEGGCQPPIEVQTAPLCEGHVAIYGAGTEPDGSVYPHEDLTIRGVPAATFENGTILEIYTDNTTISIYGYDPAQVLRFAQAVQPSLPMDIPDLNHTFSSLPSGTPGVALGTPLVLPDQETLSSPTPC
jgi:hypothetical protein